jgi:hypothetical protein
MGHADITKPERRFVFLRPSAGLRISSCSSCFNVSVLRKLAGQTAIYGLSSIVARFLNYLLTPLYTSKGVFAPAEYGVITSLYAWTAFLNVVLTFGMETAFFRFANKDNAPGTPEKLKGMTAERTYAPLLFSSCRVHAAGHSLLRQPSLPASASRHSLLRADAGGHHRHRCA